MDAGDANWSFEVAQPTVTRTAYVPQARSVDAGNVSWSFEVVEPTVTKTERPLTLADWTTPAGQQDVFAALIESGNDGGDNVDIYNEVDSIGSIVDGDMDVTSGYGFELIRLTDADGHVNISVDTTRRTESAEDLFEPGGDYAAATIWIEDAAGETGVTAVAIGAASIGGNGVNIRSTTAGGPAFLAKLAGLEDGERFILAMTLPAPAGTDYAVDADDVSWSFEVAEPTVQRGRARDAGNVNWSFEVTEPTVTRTEETSSGAPDPVGNYQTFTLGAASLAGQTLGGQQTGRIRWGASSSSSLQLGPVNAALLAGSGEVWITYVYLYFTPTGTTTRFEVFLSTTADLGQSTYTYPGPDLTSAFETGGTVTFEAGGEWVSFTAGVDADADSSEPYRWNLNADAKARLWAFIDAWHGLTDTQKAATTLTIADGATATADYAVDAGDANWSFEVAEPTVTRTAYVPQTHAVDAENVEWSFQVAQPTVTKTSPLPETHAVDAGDVSWSFQVAQPEVTKTSAYAVDAGDVSWSFRVERPAVTHTAAPGTEQTFTLGAGTYSAGSNERITWNLTASNQIESQFLAASGDGFFRRLILHVGQEQVRFLTASTATGTPGGAGPNLADSVLASGSITVRAGSERFAWNFSTATNADTAEPYTWELAQSDLNRMSAFVTAWNALTDTEKAATTLTLSANAVNTKTEHAVNANNVNWSFEVVEPTVTKTDRPAESYAVDAGDVAWSFEVVTPTVTHTGAQLSLADWSPPEGHESVFAALIESGADASGGALVYDEATSVGSIVDGDMDVTAGYSFSHIYLYNPAAHLNMSTPTRTVDADDIFETGDDFNDTTVHIQDGDGAASVLMTDIGDGNIGAGGINIRDTTTGGPALLAKVAGLSDGTRFIVALTRPIPASSHAVDAGDVSWSFEVTEPTVTKTDRLPQTYAVDAGDVSWSFQVATPTVQRDRARDAGTVNWSFEVTQPEVAKTSAHAVDAGDVNWSFQVAQPSVLKTFRPGNSQTFALGEPNAAQNAFIQWYIDQPRPTFNTALVDGGATAYFSDVTFATTSGGGAEPYIELRTGPTATAPQGDAGPDLSSAFENGGSLTIEAGGLSFSWDVAAAVAADTAEPYKWTLTSADEARLETFIGAFVLLTDAEQNAATLTIRDTRGPAEYAVDAGDANWSFEVAEPAVTKTARAPQSFAVDAGDISWSFQVAEPAVTRTARLLTLADWSPPAGERTIFAGLLSSGNDGGDNTDIYNEVDSIGSLLDGDLEVTSGYGFELIRMFDADGHVNISVDTTRRTESAEDLFEPGGDYADGTLYIEDESGELGVTFVNIGAASIGGNGVNIRSTTTGGPAFLAKLAGLSQGQRFILAMTLPTSEKAVDAGDANWSFEVAEPSVQRDRARDAGDVSWSFEVTEPTVTHTPAAATQNYAVDAGDVNWSFEVTEPAVTRTAYVPQTYAVDAGDVNWSFEVAAPTVTRTGASLSLSDWVTPDGERDVFVGIIEIGADAGDSVFLFGLDQSPVVGSILAGDLDVNASYSFRNMRLVDADDWVNIFTPSSSRSVTAESLFETAGGAHLNSTLYIQDLSGATGVAMSDLGAANIGGSGINIRGSTTGGPAFLSKLAALRQGDRLLIAFTEPIPTADAAADIMAGSPTVSASAVRQQVTDANAAFSAAAGTPLVVVTADSSQAFLAPYEQPRGSKDAVLAVSDTVPPSNTASGYQTLVWTDVGEIESIGEFGIEFNVVRYNRPSSPATRKKKGAWEYGNLQLDLLHESLDAGQGLLRTGERVRSRYSFRLDFPGGPGAERFYFQGKVMRLKRVVGTSNDSIALRVVIEIDYMGIVQDEQ